MSGRPTWTAEGHELVGGSAAGVALVLSDALSFWGGVDPASGLIIDRRHPERGADIGGRVLVMPHGRGSSSSSSVLAELLREGHGPAAIVLRGADEIVALGALVVELLDGVARPVLVVDDESYARLRTGDLVSIRPGGRISVTPADHSSTQVTPRRGSSPPT